MTEVALEDIGGSEIEPVASIVELLYAPMSYFEENGLQGLPDLDGESPAADLAAAATIATDHVFKEGMGWHKVEIVPETGSVEHGLLGNTGGKIYQNTYAFLVKGSDAKLLGWARRIKNEKLVVLAKEFKGTLRQIGSNGLPARLNEVSGGIEALVEGERALTFNVIDKNFAPAPIYAGAVQMFGDIPAGT